MMTNDKWFKMLFQLKLPTSKIVAELQRMRFVCLYATPTWEP